MWTSIQLVIADIWGWIVAHKKLTAIFFGCLAGLLLLWWVFVKIDAWYGQRQINKDKQAIVNKAQEIANVQANINAMAANRDEKLGELKVLTNSYVAASNADTQARIEANKAVANLEAVKNSNVDANSQVDDLQKKLDKLDIH